MTDKVQPIASFTQQDRDIALLGQLAMTVIELREIPTEELAMLSYGHSSAYMTMCGAMKMLQEKLVRMAVWLQAQRLDEGISMEISDQPPELSPGKSPAKT